MRVLRWFVMPAAAFHDRSGRPGFDTSARAWPHGWKGEAEVHGIVFFQVGVRVFADPVRRCNIQAVW